MQTIFRSTIAVMCLLLAACGGGGYGGNGGNTINVTLNGTISGLGSQGVGLSASIVLNSNNTAINVNNTFTLSTNGPFSLATTGAIGAAYTVTVQLNPAGQTCTVSNGTGTVTSATISGIVITCSPGSASGLGVPTQLSAGLQHTCVRFSDGNNVTLKCWGNNATGQLGQGTSNSFGSASGQMGTNLPLVNFGGGIIVETAPGGIHTCVRIVAGSVKCWGAGGVLGLGDTMTRGLLPGDMGSNLPEVDLGGGLVTQLVVGNGHACARIPLTGVKCWGLNSFGQLGLGDIAQRGDGPNEMGANLPAVNLGTNVTAADIAAGFAHSCATLNQGALKCWGSNSSGQLGVGDTSNRGDAPGEMGDALPFVNLGAGRSVNAVVAGELFTCALLDDATVKCWGSNTSGQLGLGDTTARPSPSATVALGAGVAAVELAAGQSHVCARLNTGVLKCWGANDAGQLGLGDTNARGDTAGEMGDNLPQVDLGGRMATQLTAFGNHTCVLLDDSTVKCWGANTVGQLGLGDTNNRGDMPNEMGNNLPVVNLGN